ncbi:MAG: hypothetical protein KAR32_11805, partial [Candidatus Omnitrophica bacterium]|nr:hypothetical protein [Candidatus Omnitrophota bacterium]
SASSPVVHREIAARKLAAATPAQVRKIVLGAYQGIKPAGEIREIGQKIIEMQQRQPGAFESYQRLGQAAPEVAAIVTDLGAAEAIDRTIAVEVGAQLQAPGIAQVISQPQVVQGIDTDFRVRLIPQATMPQAQVSQTMPSEIKEPFAVADGYYTRAKAASSPVTILAELGVPENESQIAQLSKPEISRALRELQGKIDKKIIIEEEPAEEDAAKELIMRAAGINRSDPPFGAINVIKEQDSFVPIVRDIVDNPRKLFVITGPMGAGKSIFSNKLASDVKRALEQKGSSLKVDVLDRDDYMAKDRKVPTLGVKDPQSYDPSTIYIVEGHGITKGVADTYYKRAVIDPVQKEIVSIGFFAPYDVAGERLRSRSREGDETLIPLFDDYYDDWYFGEDFSDYKYMVVSE